MILHIPHSSTKMFEGVYMPNLRASINLMTDWFADELFQFPTASRVVQDLSRLVVDVERFPNDAMEICGKGYVYTTDVFGYPIIRDSEPFVYRGLYDNYHTWFNTTVAGYLSYFPVAVIVDCHTFNSLPMFWESDSCDNRPDICIGVNSTHIPENLVFILADYFNSKGFLVNINNPYSGAIIPSQFIDNPNVYCIMIEVNKSLYLNNIYEKINGSFEDLQHIITGALGIIDEWESKKEDEFWGNI